jgi:hypothetical protein
MKEIRLLNSEIRGAEDSRSVEGVAAVFDQYSQDLGWFIEKIDRDAFAGADMDDVVACRNHDPDKVLARTKAGTLHLTVDDNGFGYRFDAPNTTVGNDTLEDIRVGNISHSSFAFTVKEDKWEKKDGKDVRTILRFEAIYDVSPVTNPAYLQTSVQKNSLDVAKRSYDEFIKSQEPPVKGMHWTEAATKLLAITA